MDAQTPPSDPASTPESGSNAGFGSAVKRALIWRTGTQIVAQAISWAVTLVVIRILNPADYGLYAMAGVMMTFLDFLNGYGFASALIQQKEVTRRAIRQALGVSMSLNCTIAAAQYLAAPSIAAYYGQPAVADILHLLCIVYLATPFIIVPEVLLARTLDFRRQAVVNMAGAFAGAGVALFCALHGYGVWTLVYAPIAVAFTRAAGFCIAARFTYLPTFDFRGAGGIASFGLLLMGSHLFWVVQSQSDVFIAGRLFTPHDVGLYAEALFLTQIIMSKFVPALNQVAFPAYARLQDDPRAMRYGFLRAVRLVTLVTAPMFIGIGAVAEPLVILLFRDKWAGMAPLMMVLALATPFMTVQILFAPMVNALGRPDLTLRCSLFGACTFPLAFLVGSQFGITGIAVAWLVAAPLLLLATARITAPASGLSIGDVAGAALPSIGLAMTMGGIVTAASMALPPALSPPAQLAVLMTLGLGCYAALVWTLQRTALAEAARTILPASLAARLPL